MSDSQPDLDQRIAARMQAGWNDASASLGEDEAPVDANALLAAVRARVEAEEKPAATNVVPMRRTVVGIAVAALAAAAILYMVWPRDRMAALPAYVEDAFEGGLETVRGDRPPVRAIVPLLPSSRVRWVLVPKTATDLDVEVRLAVTGDTTTCVAPTQGVRIADSGSVELAGTADELFGLPPGSYTIAALVGTKEAFAGADDPCGANNEGIATIARRRIELRAD